MKLYHFLLNAYITKLFIIIIFIKNVQNNYNYKSINLRESNEEQNIIEIEMKNNLTGNITFINLNNNNNIEMFINDEKQSNFTNIIQFESYKNYIIKLVLPNDFNGSCENMFKNIHEIKIIKFQNFNICKNIRFMFYNCSSLKSLEL